MNYQLNEIFDIGKVRNICQSFSELTGIATGVKDPENKTHVIAGLQPICGEFHRCNKESNKRCVESGINLSGQLKEGNYYSFHKCRNGLFDVAMPIMIKGIHIGNFFMGQFLMEKPDIEYFRNQAKEFGFDEQKYLAALDKVPIYTEEYIKSALLFLIHMTETIGAIGLKNLEVLESNQQLVAEKKKLVKAEKQIKNILGAVRNGLAFIDKDYKIHSVNEAVSLYSGVKAEELINKICYKVLHKRNSPCEGCPVKKTLLTGERTQGEVLIRNGRTVYITVEPVRNDKGELIGVIENFTDITEIKISENIQRETEKKMSSIFRAAPTGIGVVKNRLITEVNHKLCEITGYSEEELIGKNAQILYPTEEDYNYVGDEKYRQIKKTGTGTVETCWQRKDGSIIHVSLSSTLINIENHADGVIFTALDISQNKKAEEALRISERNNRTWIENSPVSTKIIDLDFKLQFMSISGIKQLKINDINEFYGKPYPFYFYPDSFKTPMLNNLKKVKETGKIIIQEAPVPDMEGNELWYHSTIVPVNNDKGKLDYILVVSLDTTERRQAEISLRNSEEKYRMLAETITDGIVTLDLAGRITYVNLEVEKLTGFARTYLSGHLYSEIIAPEYIEAVAEHRENELSGKKAPLYEVELLNCNGNKIPVEVNTSNLFNSNGAIVGRLAVFRNITKRKQAEKAIIESEHKYRVLTTNTLDTIWTADTNFKMTFVNGSIFNFLGYTPEEFISLKPNKFTSKEGLQIIQENAEQLLIAYKKGEINQTRLELQHIKKDGTLIDVEFRANLLLDDKGNSIGFQGRSIDISERKSAEKELIAARNKAQESDCLKTAFLHNMSHEIRTPLNGMLGFLDFIVNPDYSTEEKQEFIDIVNKSSDRLINTVTDIIDISKIEAGQMDILLEEVSVT
jgi:PAS domain S-box-containing protein